MKRKIIQITGSSETETRYASVMVLCNDGTLWRRVIKSPTSDSEDYWAKLPDIPQEGADALDPWAASRQVAPKKPRIRAKRDILKQIINLRAAFQRSHGLADGSDPWLRVPLKCWVELQKRAQETGQVSAAEMQLRAFLSRAENLSLLNFTSPDGWVAAGKLLGMKVVVNQGGNLEVSHLRNPNA
jgi:hypothetical protein